MPDTLAPFTATQVNVTSAGGLNYKEIAFAVEDGVATLTAPSGVPLGSKPGVVAIETLSARAWRVTFDDGIVWSVARGGCGCGGR